MSQFRSCTIIDAGLMGPQIAVALAAGAERIRLYDTDLPAPERAEAAVHFYLAQLTEQRL